MDAASDLFILTMYKPCMGSIPIDLDFFLKRDGNGGPSVYLMILLWLLFSIVVMWWFQSYL